ncbi:class D sortase [Proteinivorax hydrogeniformans]|uniref:Class D sortase n=1 Tax=Proteinivorax hydrogeniformans TaxID=1826727 RepID=A0AAU8HRS5_9FIRM
MKIIGVILIFLGLALIIYPPLQDFYVRNHQKQLINTYIQSRDEFEGDPEEYLREVMENLPSEDTESELGVTDPQEQDSTQKIIKDTNIIGIIEIPEIKVHLPIFYDANDSNLAKGAAMVKGTAFPWEDGNTAIAAHKGRQYGSFFNRLNEVKDGDLVKLHFLNEEYHYEVYESFVVWPDEVWVLEEVDEKAVVTLVVCISDGKKRLIVRGKLTSP